MTLSFCIIEESWDEYLMTFVNKPEKSTNIIDLVIAQSGVYKIDISNYIEGRTDISICVYVKIENYIDDYVFITSREGYYSEVYAPQLIWTYKTEFIKPVIYGYNLPILVLCIYGLGIVILMKNKRSLINREKR